MSSNHTNARHANDDDFMNIDFSSHTHLQNTNSARRNSHQSTHQQVQHFQNASQLVPVNRVNPVPHHPQCHLVNKVQPRQPLQSLQHHQPHQPCQVYQSQQAPRCHHVHHSTQDHHSSVPPAAIKTVVIHCSCQGHHGPVVTNGHQLPVVKDGCEECNNLDLCRTPPCEGALTILPHYRPVTCNGMVCSNKACCAGPIPPKCCTYHVNSQVNPTVPVHYKPKYQVTDSNATCNSCLGGSNRVRTSRKSGKRTHSGICQHSSAVHPPCSSQALPAPLKVSNPDRLAQMAQSLPPGFPEYLLEYREAARVAQAPSAAAIKPLRPMPRHERVELSVMLPNGCFLKVDVYDDNTLIEIKNELWRKYSSMMRELNDAAKYASKPASHHSSRKVSTTSVATASTSISRSSISEVQASTPAAIVHSESENRIKKSSKRLSFNSFKIRSPSLNLGRFNIWADKNEPSGSAELFNQMEEINANDELTRSYSMRKKVLGMMSKLKRSGSVQSPSESISNTPAASSPATTADSALPSSLSTPGSPVDTSSSNFSLPSSSASATPTTTPSASNPVLPVTQSSLDTYDHTKESSSWPPIENAIPVKPLFIKTTASIVLADFETDLNDKDLPTAGQSKLMAMTKEDASDYVFVGVTNEAKSEEFFDDELRLIDLNLFMPILKLVEAVGNKKEKMVNSVISQIIGKPLGELETEKTTEFCQFRVNMHSTMLATVQEREEMSIDERILYEFPAELDDIDTLQLSTKQMPNDIDTFETDRNVITSSTETLMSFPSYGDSLVDDMVIGEVSSSSSSVNEEGTTERHREKKLTFRKTSSTEGTSDSSDRVSNSNKNDSPNNELETKRQEEDDVTSLEGVDENAEYTEVVAIKGTSSLIKERNPLTEYPEVEVSNQADSTKAKKKKKSKKSSQKLAGNLDKSIVSDQSQSSTTKTTEADESKNSNVPRSFFRRLNSKAESKNLKSDTTQLSESQTTTSKNFEDHYEICFDHTARSSSTSKFGPPKSRRIEFDIWTSLVTFLHGGCHGDITGAGFADMVVLFDQIYAAEAAAKANRSAVYSADVEPAKEKKPKKRSLFRNLFRMSRQLNVIEEAASSSTESVGSQSTVQQQSLIPSTSASSSSLSTASVVTAASSQTISPTASLSPQPSSSTAPNTGISPKPASGKSGKSGASKSILSLVKRPPSAVKKVPEPQPPASSGIISIFESRPHLLPQLYQVKCRPETSLPRDLIEKLLKLYITWLRNWLQENTNKASAGASVTPTSSMSTSSSFASMSDAAASGQSSSSTANNASFSKTLTKLLNPKSPTISTKSQLSVVEEISESSSYVEMFIGSAGSFIDDMSSNSQAATTGQNNINDTASAMPSSPSSDPLSVASNALPSTSSRSLSSPSNSAISRVKTNSQSETSRLLAMLKKLEENLADFDADRYLLKICGFEQYLVGDYSLNCFEYIRNCVSKSKTPQLMLISKIAIIEKIPNYLFIFPSFLRRLSLINPQIHYFQTPTTIHMSTFSSDAKLMLISGKTSNAQRSITASSASSRSKPNQRGQSRRVSLQRLPEKQETTGDQAAGEPKPGDTNYAVICSKRTSRRPNHRKRSKSSGCALNSKELLEPDEYDDRIQLPALKKPSNIESNTNTDSNSGSPSVFSSIGGDDFQSLDFWIARSLKRKSLINLWKIQTVFRVKILLAQYVNVKDVDRIYVTAGVYHAGELLCASQTTKKIDPQNPRWDEMLEFPDLCMQDMPMSSRLSLAMCAVVNKRKPTEEYATSWLNLQLFNYRRCMLSGKILMCMWPMPKGFEGTLNPYGVTGPNPNQLTSTRLQIEFDTFPKPIVYPPKSTVLDYANIVNRQEAQFRVKLKEFISQKEIPESGKLNFSVEFKNLEPTQQAKFMHTLTPPNKVECVPFFERCSVNRFYREQSQQWISEMLRKAATRLDPFAQLSEQEKEFFWRERNVIKNNVPDALPKVLESVRWNCREEVCQMYALLEEWPYVSVDTAITLLGGRYIDTLVREFAVKSLDHGLTDGLMANYLIQLIQLLKDEPYHDNALARLLLQRSLLNRRFGHQFFWTLKSQIDEPGCAQRWCVMLEMYLRGLSPTALKITLAQVVALDEIERIGNMTSQESDQREAIKKLLKRPDIQKKVNKLYNPLNIAVPLNELLADRLRVMDSAKKPLWLEWSNPDPFAKYNNQDISAVIYKSGDDLRQDMLTLQVIRIMDLIWRRENLDLKMLPYNCVATGLNIGLIEVVKRSNTVMGIQRSGGRMAALQVDNTKLHKWIKEHNPHTYHNAVDNFTRSCAGYCVATFILGIGDRNPDNIMVNEDGQIFHIDFGHFLGHFKKKFGINRERVPFVLTYDFLQVITKGAENPLDSKEFEAFQQLCYEAYLALHENAHLLISLFVMMLGTGIPELQALEDVQYLRRTLQVDKTREEALQYFETQLDEAHGGAWSTKLDWFFHSVKHA